MELLSPVSIAISLSVLFIFLLKYANRSAKQRLPPGPSKLPLIGSIHHLAGTLVHRRLRDLALKHGPIMQLQLGQISAIVVSSPKMAREVMKTHDLAFADRPALLATTIVVYNNANIAFSPYGDYWRQMRKLCTLELLSPKKVKSFRSIREEETAHLVDYCRSCSGKSPIDLSEKIFSMINAVVCRAAFGTTRDDADELDTMIKQLAVAAGSLNAADLFPSLSFLPFLTGVRRKLLDLHNHFDQVVEEIIQQHLGNLKSKGRREEDEEDLLDVLLRVKESGGFECPVTPNNVKAVIFEMLTAGTDTSSATIDWAMSQLIRNPGAMEKAQAELRKALKGKRDICEADIQDIGYLKLVIKETMRLHPPLPLLLPRECREECEIDGYRIPAKSKVMVNAWAIGRDPEYWEDPDSFIPERFENGSAGLTGNEFEYLPFGGGRRMCPGASLGFANIELPLASLLYHFDWKLPNGMKAEDLDMSENFGIVAKRRINLCLIPTLHAPSAS